MVCLALCNCRTNSTAAGTGSTPPCSLGCTKVPSRSKQKRMVRDTSQKGCRKNEMRRWGVGVGVGVGVVGVGVGVGVVGVGVVGVVVGCWLLVVVAVAGGAAGPFDENSSISDWEILGIGSESSGCFYSWWVQPPASMGSIFIFPSDIAASKKTCLNQTCFKGLEEKNRNWTQWSVNIQKRNHLSLLVGSRSLDILPFQAFFGSHNPLEQHCRTNIQGYTSDGSQTTHRLDV